MRFLSEGMLQSFHERSFELEEHAPKILFVAGIVGVVAAGIGACRATLKLEETLEKGQLEMADVKSSDFGEGKIEPESRQEVAKVYFKSAGRVVKLYAPSVALGAISIYALTKSHNILQERNTALIAAYNAVDFAFKQYRGRVVERYGEDVDQEMRYGVEKVEITDPDTNRKKNVKRAMYSDEPSMYARFFDEHSTMWSKDNESNWVFIRNRQQYCNDLLRARGHLFLNEVYRMLGIPHTEAGSIVGWRMVDDGGDHYVDFGIFRDDETIRDFINGRNGSLLLDFNVDGVIFDKIDSPRAPLSWQYGDEHY